MPSLNTQEEELSTFFPAPMPEYLGAKECHFIASSNDKWCSVEEVQEIANYYKADLTLLENAGHINSDSGYGEWSLIKEMVVK